MNKIFKVVWNKSKECYVVVSEVAKNNSGKKKALATVLAGLAAAGSVVPMAGAYTAAGGDDAGNANAIAIGTNAHTSYTYPGGQTTGGSNGVAIGSNTQAGVSAVAVGDSAKTQGSFGTAIGFNATVETGRQPANAGTNDWDKAVNYGTYVNEDNAAYIGDVQSGLYTSNDKLAKRFNHEANADDNNSKKRSAGVAIGANSTSKSFGTAIGDLTHAENSSISMGQYSWATGASSQAIGVGSLATGNFGIAQGRQASSVTAGSVAIGALARGGQSADSAKADKGGSVAVGTASWATGSRAIAIGGIRATADNLMQPFAPGNAVENGQVVRTATDYNTQATGENSIALGAGTRTGANDAIAIGTGAAVRETDTNFTFQKRDNQGDLVTYTVTKDDYPRTADGKIDESKRVANRIYQAGKGIAIGTDARVDAKSSDSMAIGPNAHIGENSFSSAAIGSNASANNAFALAIGTTSNASALGATAVGSSSGARAEDSSAFGTGSSVTASAARGTAIGAAAQAEAVGSVALGSKSVAVTRDEIDTVGYSAKGRGRIYQGQQQGRNDNTANLFYASVTGSDVGEVSVGFDGNERQIANVAAGTKDFDAVNVAQLRNTSVVVGADKNTATVVNPITGSTKTDQATSFLVHDGQLNFYGDGNRVSTVSGDDGAKNSKVDIKFDYNGLVKAGNGSAVTVEEKSDSAGKTYFEINAKAQEKAKLENGTNTTVTGDGSTLSPYQVHVQGALEKVTSITNNGGPTLNFGGNSINITGGDLNMNNNQIKNVKDGVDGKDAVNVDQLNKVKADERHITPGTYTVSNSGDVTMTYTDGNGNLVTGETAVIKGIAKSDLTNITDGGKNVIKNLAKESIDMEDGKNTKASSREINGVKTFKVDVEGALEGITSITNQNGGPTVSFGGNSINITGGNLNMGGNQITNVKAGENDTDAVNVSQLNKKIGDNTVRLTGDNGATATQNLSQQGGLSFGVVGANNGEYITTSASGSNVAVDLSDDAKNKLNKTYNITSEDQSVTVNKKVNGNETTFDVKVARTNLGDAELTYKANGQNAQTVKVSEGLNFVDGKNITTSVDANGQVKHDLSANLDGIKTIKNGDSSIVINENPGQNQPAVTIKGGDVSVDGNQIKNVKDGVDGKDAVNVNQLNKVKADERHITPGTYNVSNDGKVTMTYTDGNGNIVSGEQAVIEGIAKSDLTNITDGGKNVIKNLAKESIDMEDGKNTKASSREINGVKTFKVDVEGALENITSITNQNGGPTLSFGGNSINITGGDLNMGGNQIKNVKDGVDGNDAVNVNQLNKAKTEVEAGDNVTVTSRTGDKGQTIYKVSSTGVNLGDANLTYKSNGQNAQTVKVSEGLNFVDGKNITTSVDANGQVKHDLSADLDGIKTIKNGDSSIVINENPGQNQPAVTIKGGDVSVDGNQIKNVKDGVDGKDAVNVNQLNKVKADERHITPGTYNVSNDGKVTMTYTDGNGNLVADETAVIEGIAKSDLTNITDGGKNVIKNLAKESIDMEDGKNTKASSREINGVKTFKVDVEGALENITSITNQNGGPTLSFGGNSINITGGDLNMGGNQIKNVKDGVDGKDAVNVDQLNKVKADERHITPGEYTVSNSGDVTMTYTDGNGNLVSGETAVIKGIAKSDLSNITNEGKKVITGLGTVVKAGDNVTVDEDTDATTGQKTYTVNAVAQDLNNTNLTYKANGQNAQSVKVSEGLNFVDGNHTTASVDVNGQVKYDVNIGNITSGQDGKAGVDGKDGIATVKTVVETINNSGWNANATGNVDGSATKTIVKPGTTVNLDAGKNLTVKQTVDANGDQTYSYALAHDITIGENGKDGKDGVDGKIGVNGKDGSAVVINGKDGSIGLNGKDGKNGVSIKGQDGKVGVDGKDGETRLVYVEKENPGKTHEIATTDDGLKFAGDDGTVISKKLNTQLDIVGGAKKADLTDDNIGVNEENGKLKVQLSKVLNLTNTGSITMGDTFINNDGLTIKNGPSITKSGINAGGQVISNVAEGVNDTDAVNVKQLRDAKTVLNDGKNTTVTGTGTAADPYKVNIEGDLKDITSITGGDNTGKVEFGKDQVVNVAGDHNIKLDAKTGDITGLTNTTIGGDTYAKAGRAATEEQLEAKGNQISNDITNNLTAKGLNFGGDDGSNIHKDLGEKLEIVGGADASKLTDNNIGVNATQDGKLKVQLSKDIDLTKDGSLTIGDTKVTDGGVKVGDNVSVTKDGFNAGNTSVNNNGITINNPADPSKTVSLTDNGLNNGGNQIKNVAEGTEDTDAVNVKQLKDSMTTVTSSDGSIIVTDAKAQDRDNTMGSHAYDIRINNQRVVENAQTPVVYTNEAGDKVYKMNDGTFNTSQDGTGTTVQPGNVIASMNNGNGSTTNPMILNNVGSAISGKEGDTYLAKLDKANESTPNAAVNVSDLKNTADNLRANEKHIAPGNYAVDDKGTVQLNYEDGNGNLTNDSVNITGLRTNIGVDAEGSGKVIGSTDPKLVTKGTQFVAGNNIILNNELPKVDGGNSAHNELRAYDPSAYNSRLAFSLNSDLSNITTIKNDGPATINIGSNEIGINGGNLNMNGNKVTNIGKGENPGDATRMDQRTIVQSQDQSVKVVESTDANGAKVYDLAVQGANDPRINELSQEIGRVGAQSAALSALKPIQYDPLEPTQIMAGYGNYRGNSAMALGVAHYKNESTMIHGGVSWAGGSSHMMMNAGVTWKVGNRDSEAAVADRYRKGPISSAYAMQTEMASMKAQNAGLKGEVSDLKAKNEEMQARNERIEAQNASMQAEMEAMRAQMAAMMAKMGM